MDTLLHVDDDPMQRLWVNHLFKDTFEVVSYEDAETALCELEHLHPSVAILDLELPGMNG
ncbi:MAG: response regulator, partial [Aquaspirillum sp.]